MGTDTLQEGVYRLQSKARGYDEVLDLNNGDWKWGPLQVWERNHTANSNGSRNQRYLITLVPGDNQQSSYYHVINLFYGCLVGVYSGQSLWRCLRGSVLMPCIAGEREESWQVKVAPSTTSEWSTQWSFLEMKPSIYSIHWRVDDNRCMDVRNSRYHGDVWASNENNSDSQLWRLERDTNMDHSGKDTAAWMSHVTGNPKLSMLNLIGTHQSLALHAKGTQGHEGPERRGTPLWDNPRCQNRSPYEQMVDGVRVFDLRLDVWVGNGWASNLYAWHGANNAFGAAEGYSFTAVLQSIKLFLTRFPKEALIIGVVNETRTDRFEEAFRNDFRHFEYLFLERHRYDKQSINQIDLDTVRGKAILLMNQSWARRCPRVFHPQTFYSGNGATVYKEGRWNLPRYRWEEKLLSCDANVRRAFHDRDENHVFDTAWNMSNALSFPAPYNPCDFWCHAHGSMVNLLKEKNIGKNGRCRIGIVNFDFYEQLEDVTMQVIRSNPGCGDLKSN